VTQAGPNGNQSAVRWALSIVIILIVAAVAWFLFAGGSGSHGRSAGLTQKWHFTASGPITGGLALATDGTIYATSEDGMLYAVDPSGHLKWKFEVGKTIEAPALGLDGTIYVSTEEEKIFAVDPAGAQKWVQGGGPYADKDPGWKAGSTAAPSIGPLESDSNAAVPSAFSPTGSSCIPATAESTPRIFKAAPHGNTRSWIRRSPST
jgi:outer membrane protein assembly factor BamB